MDEFVRTDVFDARVARIDDENDRQNQRIELLEKNSASLNDLVVSVKELAMSVKQMQEELKRQGQRLEAIEKEPAEKWKKFTWLIVTAVAGAALGFLLSKLGM